MTAALKRISFFYNPYRIEDMAHVVEKDDNGKRRRYLLGVASGPAIDGHGERITEKAIKSFHQQANSGDILLYADKHGVNYTDDIGILTKSNIDGNGDWNVEYRLYDNADNVGPNTLERADKLWKQINGLPPYKTPKQKGFSIEGFIPEGGITQMSGDGRRVIDEVQLDGCVVVPRPAYKTSIATAVYKALEGGSPFDVKKAMRDSLRPTMEGNFYRERYYIQDSLEDSIEKIMFDSSIIDKQSYLDDLMEVYKETMIQTVMKYEDYFNNTNIMPNTHGVDEVVGLYKNSTGTVSVLKSLLSELDKAQKLLETEEL